MLSNVCSTGDPGAVFISTLSSGAGILYFSWVNQDLACAAVMALSPVFFGILYWVLYEVFESFTSNTGEERTTQKTMSPTTEKLIDYATLFLMVSCLLMLFGLTTGVAAYPLWAVWSKGMTVDVAGHFGVALINVVFAKIKLAMVV